MTARLNAERYPLRFAARNGFRVHAGQLAHLQVWPACGRVWSVPLGRALPPDTPVTCERCLRRIGRPMKLAEAFAADARGRG